MSILTWILSNWSLSVTLGACITGLGIAGIATLSNIGEDSSTHLFRYIPDDSKSHNITWSKVMDGKHFTELPVVKHPYQKLLKGDAGYNEGNYIIYYGSAACPHCTGFLYNNTQLAKGDVSPTQHLMSEGAWMKAFEFTKTDSILSQKKIKFLMFDDVPDKTMVDKNDKYWTLPWSQWDYDNSQEGALKGDYIRHDRSAKEIRKIISAAKESLGDKKVPGTPTVIAYKGGKAAVFNNDTLEGLKQEKKQGESMDNEDTLKRFIKHYYTYSK